MTPIVHLRRNNFVFGALVVCLSMSSASAFGVQQTPSRFESLLVRDTERALEVSTATVDTLAPTTAARAAWEQFRAAHGPTWAVYLDRRSGAPLYAQGAGIRIPTDAGTTVDSLERDVRAFMANNASLLLAKDDELVLNRAGSGELNPGVWQIEFDRVVSGVPVTDARYIFTIGHGNLMSFGASRWTRIDTSPVPAIGPEEARARVAAYMQLDALQVETAIDSATLEFIPLIAPATDGAYAGALGAGYTSALTWKVVAGVPGVIGTWETILDAQTGAIRSFQDINDYANVKGGVYPISSNHICPDGCERNLPMPYAKVFIGNTTQQSSSNGTFNCQPNGAVAQTILRGQYFLIGDGCGSLVESTTCSSDLDLRGGGGIDCTVPTGDSRGNTHAFRTSFYHLNRINEHARTWLPAIGWLFGQVEVNVNRSDAGCTAYVDPLSHRTINFFQAGESGCANTGELPTVLMHEWAHLLDRNDGGGVDNPSEAYADITSFMMTHESCQGLGLHNFQCGGYGDTCLTCTGFRELDWDKRQRHTPWTPTTFTCPGGGSPCGGEDHCEGLIAGEAVWDLANRDLPATGLSVATSWEIVDRLWFTSRIGSGGPAYICSLPNSNGCAATSWFSQLRAIDDDDSNLANGTPHAAAIFAAFNRHKIACGTAADPSNQSSTICPPIGASTLAAALGNGTAALSWTPATNAASYRVLKNELGCAAGNNIVVNIPGTSFTENGLTNGATEYYSILPLGSNIACIGPVSNCLALTPQPFAGSVTLDATSYSCTGTIGITVSDGNIGAATTTVKVASPREPAGENVTVTQISPGSITYTGTIGLTDVNQGPPNGVLTIIDGDPITATYIDAADGGGGINLPRTALAVADCVGPEISKVQATNITGTAARITWTTNELAGSATHHGVTPPPGTSTDVASDVTQHAVDISGLSECTTYVYSVDSADVVGNTTTDDASGAYYTFTTGKSEQFSYVATDTPINIPDIDPSGASSFISTIVVTDARMVQDVNVSVDIVHTFDGDLTLSLITPAGLEIVLSDKRGGHEDNYTGTVFDDEAALPLGNDAPFTGTFRPETPLTATDGVKAAGVWKFHVVDRQGQDVGSIEHWTLQLTFATPTCGAHANLRSQARITDTCATGGIGNANTYWDAGENVKFKLTVANDGSVPLTGVTATVTSTTPGVVIQHDTATFPDIPPGATGESVAPHFTAYLPTSLACGGNAAFQVTIASNQGSWSGAFPQFVGQATNGTGRLLNERFDAGIPATWNVVDGGFGGGAAATWTSLNPGVRTMAYPMLIPVATVDSDAAGPAATQDEQLVTPSINLSTSTSAVLQFDQFFRWSSLGQDEIADVDVRSSATGNAWVNVLRQQGSGSANPDHESIDISAQGAGASNAQVRFRSWNGANEEYWQVDNVTVDGSAPGSCDMPVCSLPIASGAKPVADGILGAAMKASRGNPPATTINLTWDITTCASADQHLLYGDLADVSSLAVLGAACNLGTTGSAAWNGVPAGDLWFVVVGDDNGTTEASWGTDAGVQRGGTTASGQCGTTTRNNGGVCP